MWVRCDVPAMQVVWEDVKSLPRRPLVELILDEHDENMIFEVRV